MKIKNSIAELYRKEWLDIAAHVYISALVNLTPVIVEGEEVDLNICAEDAIKRFQRWLNLSEDDMDTDSLKSTYYRNQRRFKQAMRQEVKILPMGGQDVWMTELKEAAKQAMKELIAEEQVLLRKK